MNPRLEPPQTVGGAIERIARREPGRPALVDKTVLTYGELAAAIAETREKLAEAGLRRDDRVAALMPQGIAGARLLVALACNIGVVPVDPQLTPEALAALIDATGIKALARPGSDGSLQLERLSPARERVAMRPTRGADLSLLLRQGSRLVPLTHRDLRVLAARAQRSLRLGEAARAACLAPLHQPGIEASLFVPLILGAAVAFDRSRATFECVVPQTAPAEQRRAIPAQTNELPGLGPADDLLEMEVRDIWRRLLLRDDIAADESFFDAGGDSLLATQMLLELETLAGRPYPESELTQLTIRQIATVLKERIPEERGCLVAAKAGAALDSGDVWQRARAIRRMARMLKDRDRGWLNAVHGAGKIPFFFCHGDFQARGLYAHQLAALLPPGQPVYLLHPQREPAAGTTVEALAAQYVDEVLRVAPGSPVILGGYCNGGFVAWHLAHLLRSKGVQVLGLFLVETPSFNGRAAARWVAAPLRALPKLQETAMRAVWSLYRHGAGRFAARLGHAVLGRLRRRPGEATTLPSWWIFVRGMATRYLPPPIDVDVYCFVADEGSRLDTEPACWRRLVRSVTEVRVPGSHVSAVISHRRSLAAAFARSLSAAAMPVPASACRAAGMASVATAPATAAAAPMQTKRVQPAARSVASQTAPAAAAASAPTAAAGQTAAS